MSEPMDPQAGEIIAQTFVLRERLGRKIQRPVDIYAHESLLVRSKSGKHRIYERWADGWSRIDVPSPVRGENTQASVTPLGNNTESYEVDGRVFDKQIHGQKVEKAVTFGDLNNFSANDRRFNKDYQFASNNCQDYQERVRSELLGLPVHRSWRTAFTKIIIKLIASPQTRRHVSARSSGSALATSGSLNKISDSEQDLGL